jgi:4-hydroxy-4-methyl-2-oxoglutarate aldolase
MPLDLDFDALQRDLYTGVICDVLDSLGLRNQAMQGDIRPVHPEMTLAGRARTVLSVDVYHVPENCYEKEIGEMRFPVFAAGMRPVDSRGRSIVIDYDVPVECAGVMVLEQGAYLRDVFAKYGVL